MTDKHEVELIIKASDQSTKTLKAVSERIDSISKSLQDQVAAAQRGEGSMKELAATYKQLEQAGNDLIKQQALIDRFKLMSEQLEKTQQRADQARAAYEKFKTELEQNASVTKKQEKTLSSLEKAANKAAQAIEKQSTSLAAVRAEGEKLGIDFDNLAKAQDTVLKNARSLAASNDQLSDATRNYTTWVSQAAAAEKKLAEERAFEQKSRQAAELVRAGNYVDFWITELDKMEAKERAVQDQKLFEQKSKDAAQLVKAGEYAQFWISELEKVEAAERQLANTTELNKIADRAVAAARGFTTLGDSTKRLASNASNVQKAVRSIVDPMGEIRGTIAGVEEEVNSLAAAVVRIKGPITDYKGQVQQLQAAIKSISGQAGALDAFEKQIAIVKQARAAFVEARAAALQHAEAMRQAGAPNSELAATQQRLQAALQVTARDLQNEIAKANLLKQPLKEAGIETNNLAAAQQRLLGSARTATGALDQLNAAYKKHGEAVKDSGDSLNFFESGGRTTLSLMQRIRGEVLALTAAYVGLQGTIDFAASSLEKFSAKQGIQNQLALSAGNDPRAIGEAFEYVRGQADRIGLSFEDAAKGYAKFAAAAKLAGRSTPEIRYIFETFAEVGQVAQLSTDDLNGVFKALEQVISKGKIQAEELRGQLGDRLFGAFEIAAKALKDQFPDLDKAMKDGLITSDQLIKIAEQYKKTVAEQLPAAITSLRADQARLNSAVFDFKVLVADSGFADGFQKFVQRLTAFLQSDDGASFAKRLGDAFSTVVDVLNFIIDHLNEITILVETAFGLKAAQMVLAFAGAIGQATIKMIALTAAIQTGTAQISLLQKAFGVLAAFIVGWQIGTYLNDQFEIVRQAGVALVIGLVKGWTEIKFGAQIAATSILEYFQDNFNKVYNAAFTMAGALLVLMKDTARALGQDGIADAIDGKLKALAAKQLQGFKGDTEKLKAEMKKELAQIDEIGFQMFQEASDAYKKRAAEAARQQAAAQATLKPTITPSAPVDDGKAQKEYEKLVKKREALAEQLEHDLQAIDARIARNEKQSLEERLRAIEVSAQKTYDKIAELSKLPGGNAMAAEMKTRLDGYVKELKVQETLKFNREQVTANEKRINDLLQLRTQLYQTIDAQRKAGMLAPNQVKDAQAGVDAKLNPQISAAVESAKQFAIANKAAFADSTALDTYLAKLDAINAGLIDTKNELITVAQVNEKLASGLTNAFDGFIKNIFEGENAIQALGQAFLQFAADFLREIALMITKQLILNALQNSSIGGAIAGFTNAAVQHAGGTVGGVQNRTRNVPSGLFLNAPKYHEGGVAGLAPNEYPAILKKNEEVLTDGDPRNVLNGGANGGSGSAATPQDVTVINTVDGKSFIQEALRQPEGQKVIWNYLSANRSQIKAMLGGQG